MGVETSKRFQLIWPDVKKILVGAAMAGVGAFAAYLIDALSIIDWGQWSPFAAAIIAVLANTCLLYTSDAADE